MAPHNHPLKLTVQGCSNFVLGAPEHVKEMSDTPCKRKLDNTKPALVLLIEKKVYSTT